jgi:hypothetical protein
MMSGRSPGELVLCGFFRACFYAGRVRVSRLQKSTFVCVCVCMCVCVCVCECTWEGKFGCWCETTAKQSVHTMGSRNPARAAWSP